MCKALLIPMVLVIALAAGAYAQQGDPAPSTMDMPADKSSSPAPNAPQGQWPGWQPRWQDWGGYNGQYQNPAAGGMGCGMGMGSMGMGGMGGMGMGGMGGMGMGGNGMPAMGPQGMGMYMGQGTTIQDLVQLVTLQDILESLLKVVAIQERTLGKSTAAEKQNLLRELADIRKKIESLQEENRAQISGSSRQ